MLQSLADEVIISPKDEDEPHIGGSYMYASRWEHNLKKVQPICTAPYFKFENMSNKDKSKIIGRNYSREGVTIALDHRPENPRLDSERYIKYRHDH